MNARQGRRVRAAHFPLRLVAVDVSPLTLSAFTVKGPPPSCAVRGRVDDRDFKLARAGGSGVRRRPSQRQGRSGVSAERRQLRGFGQRMRRSAETPLQKAAEAYLYFRQLGSLLHHRYLRDNAKYGRTTYCRAKSPREPAAAGAERIGAIRNTPLFIASNRLRGNLPSPLCAS